MDGSTKKKKQKNQQEQPGVQSLQQEIPSAGVSSEKKKKKKKKKQQQEDLQSQQVEPTLDPQQQSAKKAKKQKHDLAEGKQEGGQQQQQQQEAVQQQQSTGKKKKRKHENEQAAVQQQQQPPKKHKQQAAPPQPTPVADAAQQHLTVTLEVPGAAGKSGKKPKQQQQQQQNVAAAGPWLVYMAAPDPSVYSKLQFKAYVPQDPAAVDEKGMVLLSEQDGTTLIGSTKSNISEPSAQFSGYAVGVFNKQTNTLQLAKPAGGSVVRVEALASQAGAVEVAALSKPAQQSLEQQQLVAAARQGPERDAAARRAEAKRLVEAFGSTRRKRQLQQRAEGTVVVQQNAAAGELDVLMHEVQARAQAAGDTREEIMSRLAANRVIPVHNPLAKTPQDAYQARLMFGDALMSAVNMGQMLHAAENTEDADKLKSKVPAYVVQRLQRIRDAGSNQAERKRRARLLALLAALIRLAAARPKLVVRAPQPAVAEGADGEGGRPARPGGLEELAASLRIGRQQVLELLLDKFYDKRMEGGRLMYVREAQQEQLLLMHLLVVALDLEGWQMAPQQFEMLRRELKATPADVITRFRELGCTSTAVRVQMPSEGPGSQDVVNTTSYNIALLKGGDKNLAQSFPRPKVMKKQGAR